MGHEYSRYWPFGNFRYETYIKKNIILGYVNIPIIRNIILTIKYFYHIKVLTRSKNDSHILIVYSCLEYSFKLSIQIILARFFKSFYDYKIICIVADGATPSGFDKYIYLSKYSFKRSIQKNKILFE